MSVIMKSVYFSTFLLIVYLSASIAYPRSRRDEKSIPSTAPDAFCNNFTDPLIRKNCQEMNKNARKICSDKLSNFVDELCETYYSPPDGSNNAQRKKRHIVDECCHRPCSTPYIIYHYCQHPERDMARVQKLTPIRITNQTPPSFLRETMRRKQITEEVSQHIDQEPPTFKPAKVGFAESMYGPEGFHIDATKNPLKLPAPASDFHQP